MAVSNRKRVNIKSATLLGIIAVVFLGSWGIWRFSIFGQAPSQLNEELLSAKADGLPLNASDLRRTVSVPDDENAAELIKAAIAQLNAIKGTTDGKALDKLTGNSNALSSLTAEDLERAAPFIDREAPVFATLALAVRRPKLDFHRPWEAGPGLLFPEFADEKACLKGLILKAKIEMNAGRAEDALDALDTGAKLSALVGQEPVIIGILVQASMRSMVCAELGDVLLKEHTDQAVLIKCKTVLNDLGPRPDVLPAIRSEFLMGRTAVKMLASTNGSDLFGTEGSNTAISLARFGPVRTIYDLRYTQFYHGMYNRLSKRPDSISAMTQAFKASGDEFDRKSSGDWTFGLANMLAPVFSGLGGALGESEARRAVLLAAVGIFELKLEKGQFPTSYLGSQTTADPFTEKPLIYKPTKDGFLIYSVGKDLKDDGGKPRPKDFSADQNYDIPFKFPADPVETTRKATSRGRPSTLSVPANRR